MSGAARKLYATNVFVEKITTLHGRNATRKLNHFFASYSPTLRMVLELEKSDRDCLFSLLLFVFFPNERT